MADEPDNFDEPSEHDHNEADSVDFSDTEQTDNPDEVVATGFEVDDKPEAASIDAETGESLDPQTTPEEPGGTAHETQSADDIFAAEGDFDQQADEPFSETADEPAPGMEPTGQPAGDEDLHDTETSPAGYDSATGEFDTPPDQFGEAEATDFQEAEGEDSAATSPEGYDEADLPDEAMATGQDEDTAAADDEYDPDGSFAGAEEAEHVDQTEAEEEEEAGEQDEEEEEEPLVLQEELSDIQNPAQAEPVDVEPLPEVGPYLQPATLTLYADGQQQDTYALEAESLVLGRAGQSDLPSPDIDLSAFAPEAPIWQRHVAIYRQNKNYVVFVASDGATQLNETMLELGDYRRLEDGDVLILGGAVGLEFALPQEKSTAATGATTESESTNEYLEESGAAAFDESGADTFEESGAEAFEESGADSFEESGAEAFGESGADSFQESGAEPLDEGVFDSDIPADSDFDAGADTNAGQSDVPFE